MKASQFLINTYKESPAEAETISHQLMLRASFIQKLASGIYTWSPLGLRVFKKVEAIVREEMDRSGALEMTMPTVQPAELWQKSGRWQDYGAELLRLSDRHDRAFCLGPTHEEVITEFVKKNLKSYKQLPINLYQIQTKFRDEVRPRFGIMRSREFVMKDAYSFHNTKASLQEGYDLMFEAYTKIFSRLQLDFRAVSADSGAIGGHVSQEFHILADVGEDDIVFSTDSDYSANVELAEAICLEERQSPTLDMSKKPTPNVKTIEHLIQQFNLPINKTLKTLVVKAEKDQPSPLIALLVRGDHTLNVVKAEKLDAVAKPLTFATASEIKTAYGAGPGSLGPVNSPIPFVVDRSVAAMSDFAVGANDEGHHFFGVNWDRDVALPTVTDLRNVVAGDPSPDGSGKLELKRGIEVGHIFQLGDKYSTAMNLQVIDETGQSIPLMMGCYGIGVSRVVAASIEQNHDDRGIIWPMALAPFKVAIVPLNAHKEPRVNAIAQTLYQSLKQQGIEVLFDDRDERPGIKFADLDLIGIPHRVVVSPKLLVDDCVEYKHRTENEAQQINLKAIESFLAERL